MISDKWFKWFISDKYYYRLFCVNNLLIETGDFSVFVLSLSQDFINKRYNRRKNV